MNKNATNNIGAISALRGYRVQFLYTLYRILTYKDSEAKFSPEGKFEDLDVYNQENEIVEVVQIKAFKKVLTLSDIVSSKKENTFLQRAIQAYKKGKTPVIKLVSFGEINEDVKNLSQANYSQKLINKLSKQGLSRKDIEVIKGNFQYEIVKEQDLENKILESIEKWGLLVDRNITLKLLVYWVYYSAEKQFTIFPNDFKVQYEKINKFQSERVSFSKTYNSIIQPLDYEIETENKEHLRDDFYKGISATFKHVLANVDVLRVEKLSLIQKRFNQSNIVFIHGASGQGKSTLAYRYLKDNCAETTVFELKRLPENISTIYEVINSLEGISKGIRFPITIYIDVEPGNKEWIHVLTELASKNNLRFLVTIREEDWNSIEVGDRFNFNELELTFDKEEARLIYCALDKYSKDVKFLSFDDAYDKLGGNGPLLEFVYLVTQNESLSSKLKSQINRIRKDSSALGKDKMTILRYIVLADSYGARVKVDELNQFVRINHEIFVIIDLLQNEYLVKVSGDKSTIVGLHPVRSQILKSFLFDKEIHKESDFALDAISFISDNTVFVFLRNAFKYGGLLPDLLIQRLRKFELKSWQMCFLIFKGLLWKGISDYTNKNINVLNQIYSDYGDGWKIVVNFDFSSVFSRGSMMESSDFFPEEQKQYAKAMNQRCSDKEEVFSYCSTWLAQLDVLNLLPEGGEDWNSFGLFLFWLDHLGYKSIRINFDEFQFEENLGHQPLQAIAHALYALKKYNKNSFKYVDKVEQMFLRNLSEHYHIICIEKDGMDIGCSYLFDIVDESFESEESDFMNAKSMEIVDLMRYAFPDKEQYNTKGVGHRFTFLPSNIDSSVKEIPSKNLPLKPLVEINRTYINLFEYTKRPNSWQAYVDGILTKRKLLVETMAKMIKALSLFHKQEDLRPLAEYYQNYFGSYHSTIKNHRSPKLPQNIIDEWGEHGEGTSERVKSNFVKQENIEEKQEHKQILALKRYSKFIGLNREFDSALENFLWQSAKSIMRKIKLLLQEDVSNEADNSRVSLVGNLFKAFEIVESYQEGFRLHFQKLADPTALKNVERQEVENISILCFLYRQFLYSDSFISGNPSKLALKKLQETELNFKNKISHGLKHFAKNEGIRIKIVFDNEAHRALLFAEIIKSNDIFHLMEVIYNELFRLIEQPEFSSLKFLLLNSKFPLFNICFTISGKTINSTWYEFNTYDLRENKIEELQQFKLIPQKIPENLVDKYSIEAWNGELKEFADLDKLIEGTSTAYQLAFHFAQLKYFEDKTIKDYNKEILKGHVHKISSLFQENLQIALDLLGKYAEHCNQGKILFNDDEEKNDFYEFLIDIHKYFYPNDKFYEKRKLDFTLGIKEIEEWLPRLEELNTNMSFIYYFLAGKVIQKEISSKNNIVGKQ